MLHITRALALEIDHFMDRLQRSSARARERLFPEVPQYVHDFPGGTVRIIPGHWGRAVSFGLEGPVASEVIDAVEELFRGHKMPGRFAINPYGDKGFAAELGRRGYRIEYWMQVLVRELGGSDAAPLLLPSALAIEPLAAGEANRWAEVMGEGFRSLGHEYLMDPSFHLPMAYIGESRCYFARVGGEIAGVASLMLYGDWACLMTSATLPAYRRRGIQTAFIQRRLADARDAGCNKIVLLTDPGSDSQRNAERAGFHVAYSLAMVMRDLPA